MHTHALPVSTLSPLNVRRPYCLVAFLFNHCARGNVQSMPANLRSRLLWRRMAATILILCTIVLIGYRHSQGHEIIFKVEARFSRSGSPVQQCLLQWASKHKDSDQTSPQTCPKTMPPELQERYTLSGAIRVVHQYKCQSGPEYTQKRIPYSYDLVEDHLAKARSGGWDKYGMTDEWLFNAITQYPFVGKDVVVMGSQTPWYESVCLARGALSCTTIDFQPINSSHPNITTMTLAEYDRSPRRFDVAISISSFEHDGLGRYGDPLRPEGDLDAMDKMKCVVKDGGILLLSVPIGKDTINWNMHRVYGTKRLPLLLRNWKLLDGFGYGFGERYLGHNGTGQGHDGGQEAEYQPILVLENTVSSMEANDHVLQELCKRTADERFVFPFGQHKANDHICYVPNPKECPEDSIQPRFW
uniref:Uncharacterized protein n=1 Tax=Eutreptiella gymnastica TaxID=73025 RepID=A0A7S1I807_9EUGL|mmetsp:Transcript_137262/g.238703  ORF Transcript_137262/g.238703 Transcript_137262/m.238703 type:complete len:414 (+) Transcript_137262:203-1444(+)